VTALAGELTVRQLGEMLRSRGADNLHVRHVGNTWCVMLRGWVIATPDLQDALMRAVSRIDGERRG
jgi:hypothetical protein